MNNVDAALSYCMSMIFGAEGYSAVAYLDRLPTVLTWTIGHGTTRINGKPVTKGMTCTRAQADAWACEDMRASALYVLHVIKVPLNDWQLAALTSFVYNIGDGNFFRSSVKDALDLHQYQLAADRLLAYDMAGGKVFNGLETRRERERALFLTVPNKSPVAPIVPDETDALNQAELNTLGNQS
jgi:lysozyme